ncbi:transposase [Streptosporangium fragile]|uniref:transposase n=1 Tax=Streptosporangium fragile TaxID=46186 RepID=UPI003CD06CC5
MASRRDDHNVRGDPADGQWQVLEPLLPDTAGRGRPAGGPKRQSINGSGRRVRTGAPWRDVP